MASKKEKILENAQRFVLKGQIDRAIREYQQVVALDPRDNRLRQKLAELLARDGRNEEAIEQYRDIARYYTENTDFLKAIAVYKQIQRLSPGDTVVMLTLATLSQRQGLNGNALAEYGDVVAIFEKRGELKKGVEVLEQMISLDGHNLSTRLKYAEFLLRLGDPDKAFPAFNDVIEGLKRTGDLAGAKNFQQRLQKLFPGKAVPEGKSPQPDLNLHWEDPSHRPEGTLPPSSKASHGTTPQANQGQNPFQELPLELDAGPPHQELPLSLEDDEPHLSPPAVAAPTCEEPVPPLVQKEAYASSDWEVEIELDFDEEGTMEEAPPVLSAPAVDTSVDPEAAPPFAHEPQGSSLPAPEPIPSEPAALFGDLEEFHLDQALDWLELDQPNESTDGAPADTGLGWGDIFPEWGTPAPGGDPVELESHFDLGIAYREMGMYREAIKELHAAGMSPKRRLDSLNLQALCYRDLGEPARAEELLRRGCALDGLSTSERMFLYYELGGVCEEIGKAEEAAALYQTVYEWDPQFQDVARKLGVLSAEEYFEEIELEE